MPCMQPKFIVPALRPPPPPTPLLTLGGLSQYFLIYFSSFVYSRSMKISVSPLFYCCENTCIINWWIEISNWLFYRISNLPNYYFLRPFPVTLRTLPIRQHPCHSLRRPGTRQGAADIEERTRGRTSGRSPARLRQLLPAQPAVR